MEMSCLIATSGINGSINIRGAKADINFNHSRYLFSSVILTFFVRYFNVSEVVYYISPKAKK